MQRHKPKRIFQLITVSEFGGAQSVVASLCREMSENFKVYVLYSGEGEAFSDLSNSITQLRIGPHRKEISWKDVILLIKLIYYRIKYRPDIVHLHSSKMGVLGRLAFSKKTTVYTVHGFDSVRVAFRKFLPIERLLSYKSGIIVGVSQYDLRGMKEEGIKGKISCVYNGIDDLSSFSINPETDDVSQIFLRLKDKYDKIFISIARISPPKKFELFIEIAIKQPNHAFVWIGNKEDILDLPENVYCLGSILSACRYLKYADAYILASGYEGLPISIIEAMSFSKPIIASRVGGISELVQNGVNGYLVENTVESFLEAIKRLFENENHYKQLCVNSRNSYLEYFTVNRMIEGYSDVYRKLDRE